MLAGQRDCLGCSVGVLFQHWLGALTLVAVGVAAAIGARQASNKWPWFGEIARKALLSLQAC